MPVQVSDNETRWFVTKFMYVADRKSEKKSWAMSLRVEMYKIGLRYIWLDREGFKTYMQDN
jgi:hypothetical protein